MPNAKLLTQLRTRRTKDTNYHHILYQKQHYDTGYAKRLREHPYMGGYLQRTLHSYLHSVIHDVSTPSGAVCKYAYQELVRMQEAGEIDIWNDSLSKRIDVLVEILRDRCPLAIIATLEWQRDIITDRSKSYK